MEDRVTDRGVPGVFRPVFDGKLAGQDGRAGAVAIFNHPEKISFLRVGYASQSKVVEDEELGVVHLRQVIRGPKRGFRGR